MKASVSVICYKSKILANCKNPSMIRISEGGKRKFQSLGIFVNQKFWDKKKQTKIKLPQS